MKIVNLLSAIFFITISCKEDKGHETATAEDIQVFTVAIDVEVNEPDSFSLYYTEDGSINFGDIPAIWASVEGSTDVQRVVFSLPKGAKPTQLRLDLGMNKKQEDIVLRQVTMTYGDKKFAVAGPEVFTYFRPDNSKCKVNTRTSRITAKYRDGIRQTPSLYPHEDALGIKMKSLINN